MNTLTNLVDKKLLFFLNNQVSIFRYNQFYTKIHLQNHIKAIILFVFMKFHLMGVNGVKWGTFRPKWGKVRLQWSKIRRIKISKNIKK